jgi:hypothetical protein
MADRWSGYSTTEVNAIRLGEYVMALTSPPFLAMTA